MSSGCGDVLSLADLQTAKKHQVFEAEVITGLRGGVAGGASIDYATNQVTGQVQKTMPAVLRDIGFEPASFDFTTGGTLTVNDRDKVVYDPVSKTWYSWGGALPHVIAAGTNPVGVADWHPQTDPNLRDDLASSATGKGDALINVTQPFTGAASTTQHAVNARNVSVDDFGAAGDGVTVDDSAFQAAVNSGAGRISLTAGKTYVIKNGFNIPSGVTLSGYGAVIHYVKPDFNYNHCIRIGNGTVVASDVVVEGVKIYCDAALSRDDTGFGISINKGFNTRVVDVSLDAIASAGIWVTDSVITYINRVTVLNNDADGIHISDGCTNFFITNCFVMNCNDDAIAVVSDVPADGRIPVGGVVANNVVADNGNGHAFVAIGCSNVEWVGNIARGCKGPGFGSYFWNLTGAPTEEDWVRNCKFSGNLVEACGLAPVNLNGGTGFFIGALKNCVVENNTIQGSPGAPALGTAPNCMLITNAVDVVISGNTFHNSTKYGIHTSSNNTNYAPHFTRISIVDNKFDNIADSAVWMVPNADIGEISITGNTLISSVYDSSATVASYVHRTGSNKLVIAGNKNLYNRKGFSYNTENCLNVDVYSNSPATRINYTPIIAGQGGTPTATATGSWWQEGGTVFFDVNINITAVNGATNVTYTLPFTAAASAGIEATGRENSVTGKMLYGIPDSTSVVRMINYDNTGSLSGVTSTNITASGRFIRL